MTQPTVSVVLVVEHANNEQFIAAAREWAQSAECECSVGDHSLSIMAAQDKLTEDVEAHWQDAVMRPYNIGEYVRWTHYIIQEQVSMRKPTIKPTNTVN